MKIGIDISQIVYEGTGVARFTNGLTETIISGNKKHHWLFFFSALRRKLNPKITHGIKSKGYELCTNHIPPTALSFLWNSLRTPTLETLIGKVDWFITSDWTEPPSNIINKASIVHDLTYLRYPKTVDQTIQKTQKKRLELIQKESKIIFADSKTTSKDLQQFLHIPNNKIVVNYPGVEIITQSIVQRKKVLENYKINKPYILTVGKIEPRKNLKKLVEAFSNIKDPNLELIIVGPSGWDTIIPTPHVTYLGFVSDNDLFALYESSLCFILPSLWEGFGYPIIEAMKCNTPVLCSNTSSLKEIAGNAALTFDPHNTQEIFQSMNTLIHNDSLQKKLINEGKKQASKFTWNNYYNKLLYTLEHYSL